MLISGRIILAMNMSPPVIRSGVRVRLRLFSLKYFSLLGSGGLAPTLLLSMRRFLVITSINAHCHPPHSRGFSSFVQFNMFFS